MRTVGVDLAAEPVNTGIAVVEWRPGTAEVVAAECPGPDEAVLRHVQGAAKLGIDCPLGWPDTFVDFLVAHRDLRPRSPDGITNAEWRRSLANRHTDRYVHRTLGMVPLSVATDRIGLTAMRAASLQSLLARHGHTIDRAGSGLLVEVYPAAGLRHWALTHRGYKGGKGRDVLGTMVDGLTRAAPWLRLGEFEKVCRNSDHVFDAVVAALLARATALGLTTPPPAELRDAATREGWIALPRCSLDELVEVSRR
jgi:predicted nuclease with RNAse H fold